MKRNTLKFLNLLKNSTSIKKESFDIKISTQIIPLIKAFYSAGLIQSFYLSKKIGAIRVFLRYTVFGNPFSNMKIFSTATKKLFLNYLDICRINTKRKLFLFSTNTGFLTTFFCTRYKKGGKLYLSFF
jgi:ribosomal protein S8